MLKVMSLVWVAMVAAGCSSSASRMADCQAQYGQAAQHYKKVIVRIDGVDIKIYPDDKQAYIESTAAALIEEKADAQVYQKGIFTAIWYKISHQVALMRNGKFVAKTKI